MLPDKDLGVHLLISSRAVLHHVCIFKRISSNITYIYTNYISLCEIGVPKITSDLSIRDMIVIAGEEFTITVPFIAIPKPKALWTINSTEVFSDSRIKYDTTDTTCTFHNKCAKRSDTGNYTIKLINSEGSDSASCRVLVVDKPTPPVGPLDVSDITPDTCTLSWKPPMDDGGSPITNYVVEKLDPSGVSILSFIIIVSVFLKHMFYESN